MAVQGWICGKYWFWAHCGYPAIGITIKLLDIANNHRNAANDAWPQRYGLLITVYALQTLKDTSALFTPEVLDRINQIVVKHGHDVIGKKADERAKSKL